MILNLLKESKIKLNEEINLDNPNFVTSAFRIYELTNRNDFANFTINGNNGVADHFGFSQNNWDQYVVQGQVKPLVITTTESNECIAMMLIWSNSSYNFQIREDKTVALPISFESSSDNSSNSYVSFINQYHSTLPLWDILNDYYDFVNTDFTQHISQEADGAYITNNTLVGVFEEFYSYGENVYDYKDLTLPARLGAKSISQTDRAFSFGENPEWIIHWTDATTQFEANCIANIEAINNVQFDFAGSPELWDKIENTFSEEIVTAILYADDETRQRVANQRAQAERERQEAADREVAEKFDADVEYVFELITADNYEYNPNLNDLLNTLQDRYNNLNDHQKQLQTSNGNLEIAINKQHELKNIEEDNAKKREAQEFIDDFNQLLTDIVMVDNYTYNRRVDVNIATIETGYEENLSDGAKEKLLTDFNFNYEEKLNEIKTIQDEARTEYENNRTRRLEDPNLFVIDDCVIIKVSGNYASVIASRRSNNNPKEVTIPYKVDGPNGEAIVRRIEKNAFIHNGTISKVFLPRTIRYIGDGAFYDSGIKIYIPERIYSSLSSREKLKLGNNALNSSGEDEDARSNRSANLNDYFKASSSWSRSIYSY